MSDFERLQLARCRSSTSAIQIDRRGGRTSFSKSVAATFDIKGQGRAG
jgi:hypothetical protein